MEQRNTATSSTTKSSKMGSICFTSQAWLQQLTRGNMKRVRPRNSQSKRRAKPQHSLRQARTVPEQIKLTMARRLLHSKLRANQVRTEPARSGRDSQDGTPLPGNRTQQPPLRTCRRAPSPSRSAFRHRPTFDRPALALVAVLSVSCSAFAGEALSPVLPHASPSRLA